MNFSRPLLNHARPYPVFVALVLSILITSSAGAAWIDSVQSALRYMNRKVMVPELEDTVTHNGSWPGEEPLTSSASLVPSGPVVAGSEIVLRVVYEAGNGGLARGGGIRVAFEHGADWGEIQLKDPRRKNYATIKGPTGVVFDLSANDMLGVCTLIQAEVVEGRLQEGDTLAFVLGDRSGGSPGFEVTTVSEVPGSGRVRVFEDRSGSGHFYRVTGVPELHVHAGLPHHLRVIARSWAVVGGPVDAVAHVDDEFNNPITTYRGWFTVSDFGTGERVGEIRLRPKNNGVAKVRGVRCSEEGIMRLKVTSVAGGMAAISNPIECIAEGDVPRHYFGSIHNHTLASDGLNTPEAATRFARDYSNLDFVSITDHVAWPDWDYDPVLLRHAQDEESWDEASRVAKEYNEPGSFLTFLGFEWSTSAYGDKNIYFLDHDASYRELPADQLGLYRALSGESVLVITHTMMGISGMRGPRWEYVDESYEKVMEIASYHGVREYGGNNYPICPRDGMYPAFLTRDNLAGGVLEQGIRVGFVGGSDDHSGKPGAGVKGILACEIDGLAGVRLPELTNEAVYHAFRDRHTFATTGPRMLIDFSVGGNYMGSEYRAGKGEARAVTATVHGEAPIKEVAVISGDPKDPAKVWSFDPPLLDPDPLAWVDTSTLRGPTWYYLRVIQVDDQMGWSSPVWVDPK